jgi:hypothetical protein
MTQRERFVNRRVNYARKFGGGTARKRSRAAHAKKYDRDVTAAVSPNFISFKAAACRGM